MMLLADKNRRSTQIVIQFTMKRWLSMLFTHCLSMAFGALMLLGLYVVLWSSTGHLGALRENGVGWFHFGPAVIANCQCTKVDLWWDGFAQHLSTTDPQKIAAVKRWILDNNISRQFSYAPMWPKDVGRDMVAQSSLMLSSSTDPDNAASVIIHIPLEPLSTGINQAQLPAKIAELQKLIGSN